MIKAEENICFRYHGDQRETSVWRGKGLKVIENNNNFAIGGFLVERLRLLTELSSPDWTGLK